MPVLDCFGEDIDFPNGSSVSVDLSGGSFIAGYGRCGICAAVAASTIKSTLFPGGAVSSCWFSFRAGNPGVISTALGLPGIFNSSADKGIMLGVGADTTLHLYSADLGTSTFTLLASESSPSYTGSVTHRIDINIQNYGAAATVTVYLDGVSRIAYTGNISFGGTVTSVDSVWIRSGNQLVYVSEMIVADEDSRTMSLVTLAPSAAGTTDTWTGVYTDVNETTINDANTVYVDADVQDEQFNLNNLPAGVFQIRAVKGSMRGTKTGGATATKVGVGINSGGTVDAGTLQNMTTGWVTYERLMLVNPVTGVAFTLSEINSLQSNLRSGV